MDRIERAWLFDDGTSPRQSLVAEYQGTWLIDARRSGLLTIFPAIDSVRDHVYIVDPLGNGMMRFPKDADPGKMVKDLSCLLKVSRRG